MARTSEEIQTELDQLSSRPTFSGGFNNSVSAPIARVFALQGQLRRAKEKERNASFQNATGVDTNSPAIPQSFEQAVALANSKNEERFTQGNQLFDLQQQRAGQFGQTRREQIRREDIRQKGQDTQSLIDRGLLNSSGFEDLQRGRTQDRRFQETALDESLLRERNQITNQRIGFIERRTDAAPDPALFLQAQTAAASAPTGFSGGGSLSIRSLGSTTRSDGSPRRSSSNNPLATRIGGNRLVRTNSRSNESSGARTRNAQRAEGRSDALANFQRRGVNFGKISRSEINNLLASVGVVITNAQQVNSLSRPQIDAIKRAIGNRTNR